MRGQRFHTTTLKQLLPNTPDEKGGRGRSAALIERRNEKLAYRYYYKSRVQQIRDWEQIVNELSQEFDIASATISRTLTLTLADTVRELMQQKPSVSEMKKRYPYMVW